MAPKIQRDGSVSMRVSKGAQRANELRTGTFKDDLARAGADAEYIREKMKQIQEAAERGDLKAARAIMQQAMSQYDSESASSVREGRLSAAGRARAMTSRGRRK